MAVATKLLNRVGRLARDRDEKVSVSVIDLRELASEITTAPVYKAAASGLISSFFHALDSDLLIAKPVVLAATAGTPRHALVVDEQMRSLFAYMRTTVPTSVFAASEDWNNSELGQRIDRAAIELLLLKESGFTEKIRSESWKRYSHEYGSLLRGVRAVRAPRLAARGRDRCVAGELAADLCLRDGVHVPVPAVPGRAAAFAEMAPVRRVRRRRSGLHGGDLGNRAGSEGGEFDSVDNPLGIEATGRIDTGVGWLLFVLAVLGSVAAAVARLRRSAGVERQQLKWFTYAAAMVALTWVTVTIGSEAGPPFTTIAGLMLPVVIFALPLAVFIAIFKHHLYDIDLVISRTIVVAVLAVLVTGGYVAVVAGLGTAIGQAGEISLGLAVVATALVAVAFQPVRVRAQQLANRLVYGRRATPYEVLSTLARRMGDTYAADDLLPHLAKTFAEGTGASRVEVWLLADRRLHCVAWLPAAGDRPGAVPVAADGSLPSLPQAGDVVAVRHQGGLVGALAVMLPPCHSLSAVEQRLLADLAAQVGVALDNLRLVEELKAWQTRCCGACSV